MWCCCLIGQTILTLVQPWPVRVITDYVVESPTISHDARTTGDVLALPMGATVLIGLLVVVASTVNESALLLTFAEELRHRDRLSPFDAVLSAAKIRLRPRVMISMSIIVGFISLSLNMEEGGDMLQPMAMGAIGGLGLGILVALFLMPCFYVVFSKKGG